MPHYYNILNKTISLQSDHPLFIEEFHKDYHWFKQTLNHECACDIKICFHGNELLINQHRIDLSTHPTPIHHAFQVVISEIMSQLHDYYLIHAGVVKKDNHVIVLSGPPGIGKSTLVKTLIMNGFDFFSDDCAPLHKESGLIYPFPRSMWIVDHPPNETNTIRTKKAIPVAYRPDKSPPVKPTIMICLIDDSDVDQHIKINMSLKVSNSPLIKALKQLPNIKCMKRHPLHEEYRIQYPASEHTTQAIHTICQKYKQDLWTMYRVPHIRDCFKCQAKITKVSTHEAAAKMMSEMKMFESYFTPSNKDAPMASLINMSRLIQNANCYFLSTGNLVSEIELIYHALND